MKYHLSLLIDVRDKPFMTRMDVVEAISRMVKKDLHPDERDIQKVTVVSISPLEVQ